MTTTLDRRVRAGTAGEWYGTDFVALGRFGRRRAPIRSGSTTMGAQSGMSEVSRVITLLTTNWMGLSVMSAANRGKDLSR